MSNFVFQLFFVLMISASALSTWPKGLATWECYFFVTDFLLVCTGLVQELQHNMFTHFSLRAPGTFFMVLLLVCFVLIDTE